MDFNIDSLRTMLNSLRDESSLISSGLDSLDLNADSSIVAANGKLMMLKESLSSWRVWSDKILSKVDPGQVIAEMNNRGQIFSVISEAIAKAENIVLKATSLPVAAVPRRNAAAKLPVIQLPVFDGNPTNYPSFMEAFKIIHDDSNLSDATKLIYLIGQLRGRALSALEGFEKIDANYSEALQLLKSKYGDRDVIINTYFDNLIALKAPSHEFSSFDKFVATIETNARQLKAIDSTLYYDSKYLLARLVELKLPSSLRESFDRSHKGRWEFDDLRENLQIELNHLEKNRVRSAQIKEPVNEKRNKSQFRATAAVATEDTYDIAPVQGQRICQLCFEAHSIFHCVKYNTQKVRRERIRQLRLCHKCLRKNHFAVNCPTNRRCNRCNGEHHGVLCFSNYPSFGRDKQDFVGPRNYDKGERGGARNYASARRLNSAHSASDVRYSGNKMAPQQVTQASIGNARDNVVLSVVDRNDISSINEIGRNEATSLPVSAGTAAAIPTAILRLRKTRGVYNVRALFDLGSQRSFVLADIVRNIKYKIVRREILTISGFGNKGNHKAYDVIAVNVKTDCSVISMEVLIIDALPEVPNPPGIDEVALKLSARGIRLADEFGSDTSIELLVGADNYYKFVEYPTVDNVRLIESRVGMLVSGPCPTTSSSTVGVGTITAMTISASESPTDVDMLWRLDAVGINPEEIHPDDQLAQQKFEESIERVGNQYIARLPWRAEHPVLPTNFGLARGRLTNTLNNLRRDSTKLQLYNKVIKEQLQNDFIEEVNTECATGGNIIHYIPHHAVYKESLTTPLRIVFDCSAKTNKHAVSLNSCLLSGPSLVPELTKVLLRFRLDKYAITADIAKAFLMIGLNVEDRDATRFLWVKDPDSEVITYRFKAILFGATCSQFILNATIKRHLETVNPEERILADRINRNIYVDNILHTSNSLEEISAFYEGATKILADADLPLRSWTTNSSEVKGRINQDSVDDRIEVPVLGIAWNTETDMLALKPHPVDLVLSTKRLVLKAIASQYDPLGIMSPVTIVGKLLMQEIWREHYDWDDMLPDSIKIRWEAIATEFNKLNTIEVPRSMLQRGIVSLHAFADASKIAYGAVIYAVQNGKSALLFAKGKVAPISTKVTANESQLSIPRLELTAATIATRLVKYVMDAYADEFEFEEIHLYSDSQISLGWIKSKQTLPVYVQNRVNEIARILPDAKWHHVESSENPADIVSRGTDVATLKGHRLWWNGPSFLRGMLPPEVPEQRDCRIVSLPTTAVVANEADLIRIKIIENCSSWHKVLRLHAWLVRCVKFWKKDSVMRQSGSLLTTPLEAAEIVSSERSMIISTQRLEYPEVYAYLRNPKSIRRPNLFNHLNLGIDDGMIVVITRLKSADVSESAKRPILLPTKHCATTLLIRKAHYDQLHMGIASTIACLRERFWIPKGRQQVKTYVERCVVCRKFHGVAYKKPPMPPLPALRVQEARPFVNCGVDFCGPFNTGSKSTSIKRWVALFTCASTRAVHLEVADDLSATSFIHVLHRFVSRRGFPKCMLSDNGTNFTLTAKILKNWKHHQSLQSTLANHHCEWKFTPSRSPWWGGFFERLVKMTKLSLNKSLGCNRVTDGELRTLMCRIEAQLNDRPLTFVSDHPDDLPPLTPSMLTSGFRLDSIPQPTIDPEDDDPSEIDGELLNKRQYHNQKVYQKFVTRWNNEYLKMLRQTGEKTAPNVVPQVEDVVLIHDDTPRVNWQLGRIVSTMAGPDGHIRVAKVKTKLGTLTRPIARLYPLEVRRQRDVDEVEAGEEEPPSQPLVVDQPSSVSTDVALTDVQGPPVRAAAQRAAQLIHKQSAYMRGGSV